MWRLRAANKRTVSLTRESCFLKDVPPCVTDQACVIPRRVRRSVSVDGTRAQAFGACSAALAEMLLPSVSFSAYVFGRTDVGRREQKVTHRRSFVVGAEWTPQMGTFIGLPATPPDLPWDCSVPDVGFSSIIAKSSQPRRLSFAVCRSCLSLLPYPRLPSHSQPFPFYGTAGLCDTTTVSTYNRLSSPASSPPSNLYHMPLVLVQCILIWRFRRTGSFH
ncbi:hypothetical protein OF83DRAFT_728036 [Amylostereum chailletii]|nr:hypothetical protein OF83DRAFT_728036 [Amylostereum chailletii]